MGELPPPFVVLQDVVFGEPIEALAVDVLRRVEAEPVDAEVQPELGDRLHLATHAGIVEIEVRHVAAEYALKIGRASCRERGENAGVPVAANVRSVTAWCQGGV